MLEKLLELLRQGSVHTYAELAGKLGVSESLLEGMLEDLQRRGYLKLVSRQCPGHCQGCSLESICAVGGQGRIWALTEKGAQLLQGKSPP